MSSLFEDELDYLRDTGREFARLNPKLAKHLSEASPDPDVERISEGLAFLTSQIREKLGNELPELTHSMVQLLWPNFLRPFPPTAMMKFSPAGQALTERHIIPRGTGFVSRLVSGVACEFRTTADCTLYPLEISNVRLERTRDQSRLYIDFATLSGLPLSALALDDLRINFTGDSAVAQMLYLWTRRYLRSVTVQPDGGEAHKTLPAGCVKPGGLGGNEAILPVDATAFDGPRLLREFFVFPDKFHCIDVTGLGAVTRTIAASGFTLEFSYERPVPIDVRLRPDNISLYCVPAVNLFACDGEPFTVRHDKAGYRVRARLASDECEIFSIDGVTGTTDRTRERPDAHVRRFPVFESFEHEIEMAGAREQIYYRHRVERASNGEGFEHQIAFVLHDGKRGLPREESISLALTCFNRSLAAELAVGDICETAGTALPFMTFSNITRPMPPVYPPLDGSLNWDMISNMSLNYMSLLDARALSAILAIYDHRALSVRQAERAGRQRLEGIVSLNTKPCNRIVKGLPVWGLRSHITLRENCFQTEGEMYVFASVLAEFFALYTTVNSFHELEVKGEQRGEVFRWPAKLGR